MRLTPLKRSQNVGLEPIFDSLEVTLKTFRSGLADTDMAEAITELVNRQGSLEAAMLANSNILNITLTDYLR